MKKFKKWAAYIVITLILVVVAAISYIMLALPNVGEAENIKIELTPQRIARGKYLVQVTSCLDCHSRGDRAKFASPVDSAFYGAGGGVFSKDEGFPGTVNVPNITPYNLKNWTDGEIFRAVTTGVRKNGSAIFPIMPWPFYAKMDREDIYSIIAYIRTLKPVEADYPKSKLDFPLYIIIHTMPQKAGLTTKPDPHDTIKYGAYLVQAAACSECHSQDKQGVPIAGLEFAGGKEFGVGGNTLRSANITPDNETGIGKWTKEQFIASFKAYSDPAKAAKVGPNEFQTIMPRWQYAKLTEGDIASIYAYLRTLKPVNNKVVKWQVNSGALASN